MQTSFYDFIISLCLTVKNNVTMLKSLIIPKIGFIVFMQNRSSIVDSYERRILRRNSNNGSGNITNTHCHKINLFIL